jgi:prostamide/prostaglandin F2alpha synthase
MQLHRAHRKITDAGARLTLIGQATPKHAAHYRRRFAPSVQILADENRTTYPLAGAIRGGASQIVGPSVVLKGIGRSLKDRTVQGRPIGDVAQLGGTLIVLPDGTIPWSHLSRDAADNATIEEILEALSEVASRADAA